MSHSPIVSNRFAWQRLWLSVLGSLFLFANSASSGEVLVGIEGHYRVGRWTGVRVQGETAAFQMIETRDGDGVEVRYVQPEGKDAEDWSYVVPGSEAAPLLIRDDGGVIASTRFPTLGSPSRGPAMIPTTMPWLVVLGDPLGIDQIGANKLLDRDALIAVSRPDAPESFPDSSLGYDGVDMMIMGGSSLPLLSALSESQGQAIADWITDGGRVFLTLGESAPELFQAAPWLSRLLPIAEVEVARIDPSSIETFTSSQTPLKPFGGVILPRNEGRVLIMGRTTRRTNTPVAVEFNVGLGRITVLTADLESDLFTSWPERLDLITQLTGSMLVVNQEPQSRKSRITAYNDLSGQVRSSLDQFKIKRQFSFSVVSLILMALMAIIGPLDYLLLNRFFGRPILGWITFPVVAVGLSVILVSQSRPVASSELDSADASDSRQQCNRIEIVDIDSTLEIGRGFSVNYLYSHEATRAEVQVTESDALSRMTARTGRMLTSPFGYPGESFGGIPIAIEDSRLPVYEVSLRRESSEGGKEKLRSSLVGVPLASRSSKGLVTRSRFVPKLSTRQSIERRPGSELLRGELVNPLPVDLLNGMLIYRNWTYLLPTRFPAGGRIPSVDALRQKNFRWQLSRQQALDNTTETEAWDPADITSTDRIAEMLMFHGAVGGTRYTTLFHEPLSFLDLSHVLSDDRCILLGQVADAATRFEATFSESGVEPPGQRLTFVRVVLPVIDPKKQN